MRRPIKLSVDDLCSNAYGAEHGRFVRTEYFSSGSVPTEYCTCHQRIKICTKTGHAASEYCPSEEVVFLIKDESYKTADSNYMLPSEAQTICTECDGSQVIDDIFGTNNNEENDGEDEDYVNPPASD